MKRVASLLIAFLGMTAGARAQSLLDAGGPAGTSPYDPPRPPAYKKHDLIEVVFAERVRGGQTETTTSITAEVTDVRPNGTLVLQGIRTMKIRGEDESVAFTAEASPQCVSANRVRAEKLANLHLIRAGEKR